MWVFLQTYRLQDRRAPEYRAPFLFGGSVVAPARE